VHKDGPLFKNTRGLAIKAEPQPFHLANMKDPDIVVTLSDKLANMPSDVIDESWLDRRNAVLVSTPRDCMLAIKELKQESTLGLSIHGNLRRSPGKLSFISMSTSSKVVIFDVVSLDSDIRKTGSYLSDILQSNSILKVCTESGVISDVIKRNYNVELSNTFDVQVIDGYIASSAEDNYTPDMYPSLTFLLHFYMDISLPQADYCIKSERDRDCWLTRPIHSYLLDSAILDCRHLVDLHHILQARLNRRAAAICNLRLNQFRSTEGQELKTCKPPIVNPKALIDPRQNVRPSQYLRHLEKQRFSRSIRHAPNELEMQKVNEIHERKQRSAQAAIFGPVEDLRRQKAHIKGRIFKDSS
jgi:hypothetical protein